MYVLSPFGYVYFEVDLLATKIRNVTVQQVSSELYEGVVFEGYLFLANGQAGVGVYKILDSHDLEFVMSIKDVVAMDIKVDTVRKLLYVLDANRGVEVYEVNNPAKPTSYDTINLENITYANSNIEVNGKTILVMFYRGIKNTIA